MIGHERDPFPRAPVADASLDVLPDRSGLHTVEFTGEEEHDPDFPAVLGGGGQGRREHFGVVLGTKFAARLDADNAGGHPGENAYHGLLHMLRAGASGNPTVPLTG